jgi:alpha-ketoglutarate-dependent taurine dioxygenase
VNPNPQPEFAKTPFARRSPKPVRLAGDDVAVKRPAAPPSRLPLLYECFVEDYPLTTWAQQHAQELGRELLEHGGILLRGFASNGLADFRSFAAAVSREVLEYNERSSPRTELAQGVYTSTDHPPDQPIVMHNEQSYNVVWPLKIMFYCAQPALRGGRTPIADSRRLLERLSPKSIAVFKEKGIRYVRNYNGGLGLTWQQTFQTDDPAEVERYCAQARIDVHWKSGGRLRTEQVRPAIRRHPQTGEAIWFNHGLFFNVNSLASELRDALIAAVGESELSTHTSYGDGTPIELETIEELRSAYDSERVLFDWRTGDVLLLDNMLASHGREPYEGPRKILTVMADLTDGSPNHPADDTKSTRQ